VSPCSAIAGPSRFMAEDAMSPEERLEAFAELWAKGALRAAGKGLVEQEAVIEPQKPVWRPFRVVQGGLTSGDARASM